MTTNGVSLPLVAEELKKAGLRRVNISLDSLQRDRFLELTRRDDWIAARRCRRSVAAGFDPVKVNVVA